MLEPCFDSAGKRVPEVKKTQADKLREEAEKRLLKKLAKDPEMDYTDAFDSVVKEMKEEVEREIRAKIRRTESVFSAVKKGIEEYKQTGKITILSGMNPKENAYSLSLIKEGYVRSLNDVFNPVYEYLGNKMWIPFIRNGHNPADALLIDAWKKRSEGLGTGDKKLDSLADGLIKYTTRVKNELEMHGLIDKNIQSYIPNPIWQPEKLMSRFDGDYKKNEQFFIDKMWEFRDRDYYRGWTKEEFYEGYSKAFFNMVKGKNEAYRETNNFANRFSRERYIYIGDGIGWAESNKLFGSTTLLNTLAYNLNGVGSYIATLRKFGADPASTMKNIVDSINDDLEVRLKNGELSNEAYDKEKLSLALAQKELHYYASLDNFIVDRGLARIFSEIAWMGRTKLGSASVINFIGNSSFVPQVSRIWNKSGHNAVLDMIKSTLLNPNLKQRRRMLNDAKLMTAVQVHASFRDSADVFNNGFFKYITQGMFNTTFAHRAEEVFRQAGRHIMTNSIANSLKDGDLLADNISGKLLRDWGFTEQDADIIKGIEFTEGEFTVNDIWKANVSDELKQALEEKILGVVYLETVMRTSVPTQKAQYKYHNLLGFDLRPGTAGGAVSDTMFLLQKFNIANINNTVKTIKYIPGMGNKLLFTSTVILGGLLSGMLYRQVNNLLHGKDPVDMTDWEEWQKSLFMGSLGNIAVSTFNNGEYGRNTAQFVAGGFSPIYDVVDAGVGYVNDIKSDSPSRSRNAGKKAASKLFRATYSSVPYTNYLYTRTALDHSLKLYMQNIIDPNTTIRSKQNALKRGDRFFISPDNASMRMPDFERAIGK